MKFHSKGRTIFIIISIVLIIGFLAYAAADRYLIQHVEISDVSQYFASAAPWPTATVGSDFLTASPTAEITQPAVSDTMPAASATGPISSATGPISSNTLPPVTATKAPTPTPKPTLAPTPTITPKPTIKADYWHYYSSTMSISIEKVVTGSGDDTVTAYVADVILKDATQLRSAFAKNQFGQNIIEYTSVIAKNNNAVFAINGDYYGFRTTGVVLRNGVLFRDNPARIGMAQYRDGTLKAYDETATTGAKLLAAGVWNTASFGPGLLINGVIPEGIDTVQVDTSFGYTIQGDQPRTGIGVVSPNHYIFIVVDGRSPGYSKGVDMIEFAQMFQSLGCTDAYNMDGGGSATMYFRGRVVNIPLGKGTERGTSDIFYIGY